MCNSEKKKLTRLILVALMSAGGGLLNLPGSAEAVSYSINGTVEHEGTTKTFTESNITGSGYGSGNEAFGDPLTSAVGYTVTITSPTYWDTFEAADGGKGTVSGNTLTIMGDNSNFGAVYGGWVTGTANGDSGAATGNTVNINGGTVGIVTGGQVGGGYFTVTGDANDNTVTISGGKVNNYIYGGSAGNGGASGNTVTIQKDAELGSNARIYGGFAMNGEANNNTVNILKAITVKHILGGEGTSATGNTLNIAAKGVTVGDEGVVGFQKMNFYLPSDIANGNTMLTVNAKSELTGDGIATDLTNVTIGAAAQSGVSLAKGDTVNLISNSAGFTGTAATTTLTMAPKATSLTVDTSYKFSIAQGDTAVTATVADIEEKQNEERTEQAKSLIETRAAATTFVNSGADMLASQGFSQAANAVALEAAEKAKDGAAAPSANAFTPFAAIGGSSMRAETGSYVKTKGFGLNVGFAREIANSQGKLLFGPVVEYGGGSYDSYLEDAAGTHGDGGAHYYGLGLMARQVNHDGLYYEGSIRGGRVKADFNSTLDQLGKVNYDSSSTYWAAHLGVGKVFAVGSNNKLDGYLKYFYSHQAGDTTTVHIQNAADESARFDSVDSNRIRVGARLTHKVNDQNSFYGGLAYQYEFGGEARAHFAGGGAVPSPSLKGSSGMMELGWQYKKNNVTVDLGMNGWIGKQRGLSAQLGATWTF